MAAPPTTGPPTTGPPTAGPPMAGPPMDPALSAEDTAWVVITVSAITMTMAMLTLGARVYTRAVIVKQFGADDYGAVAAGVSLLLCGIFVCLNTKNGLGKHMWTLSPPEIVEYFRYFFLSLVWYNVTLVVVKLSFLAQYYRVFSIPSIRRIIIGFMFVVGAWSLSQVFITIWGCSPVAKFWDQALPGRCLALFPQMYINAAGNIASDVAIFCLPIPILKSLNLRRQQKVLVMAIFGLGFFTCAISVVRIKYLQQAVDLSWQNVAASCWSVGELSSAVTCLCLPTLKPLVQQVLPHLVGGSSSGKSSGHSGHSGHAGPGSGSAGAVHGHSSRGYRKHSEGGGSSITASQTTDSQEAVRTSRRVSRSGAAALATAMTTESQDELYRVDDMELSISSSHGSFGPEGKGSHDVEAAAGLHQHHGIDADHTADTAPTTPVSDRRDTLLGLWTTVRTDIGATPSQVPVPLFGDSRGTHQQIQVTRDVTTRSMPRRL
ncbi:hypothetical protein SPBR_04202 [Sporothrix brasiliensis 5110]|uniref:Rhodopsin domain-containing protein n=1 Tax=Sporothrix brasiliensis 5110 TaxID=1398154 RepID=A0A0C2J2V9_9PEZI|nr:uncharacterized protein SPBR_04202 [Sporothrix brasiliensis 5110]KIH93380.1 hypothetical protein SPBR_04202 [Sporothrix brasiliensis 5110]